MAGTPFPGIALVLQKSAAVRRETYALTLASAAMNNKNDKMGQV
jgi:hypothetical protein